MTLEQASSHAEKILADTEETLNRNPDVVDIFEGHCIEIIDLLEYVRDLGKWRRLSNVDQRLP